MKTNRTAARVVTVAMASAIFLVLPVTISVTSDFLQGAAFAKSDKSKGNSGGGNSGGNAHGNSGKSSSSKSNSAGSRGKSPHWKKMLVAPAENVTFADDAAPLRPNEKGRWNASNASVNAFNAHIKNENFNGTIGALAQFKLAATAAEGVPLNAFEQRALDGFVDLAPLEIDDSAMADYLNMDGASEEPIFEVVDGIVSCISNCPKDIDNEDGTNDYETLESEAQDALDDELARLDEEHQEAVLNDFLSESEMRIIDESNKSLSDERNEDLLDELAADLGVVRAPLEVAPEDEVTID